MLYGYRKMRPVERRFLLELSIPLPLIHLVWMQLKVEIVRKQDDSHSQ
ncbi:hypothetical protein SAMN05421799_1164 [Alicyclobacillus vulcanalis]|uniref:Uncharacterized protein n=1 Tax=Alicyclobacillus vulcanalis TaxID=252246 RepID=A0A1N7PQE0_9BACL|nr:hypothetical protein SAMN05421799_1164 [Alicyclobacillus vulcanalis]